MRKLLIGFIAFASFMTLLGLQGGSASAAETEQDQTPATTTGAYEYVSEKDNSLTKIVRRSLQLYAELQAKTELSDAATVYAETNITQRLGSYDLAVGQEVNVPFALLDEYVKSSAQLTPAQLARWEKYVPYVNFDVSSIKPINLTGTSSDSTDDPSESPDSQQNEEAGQTDQANDDSKPSAYWWLIGIGAIVVVYFVVGGPTPRLKNRRP